jgi:hypothetical protein
MLTMRKAAAQRLDQALNFMIETRVVRAGARLARMHRRVWLVGVALAFGLGGCATGAPSGPSTAGAPPTSSGGSACPSSINLNYTDNGKTACLARGGFVLVQLVGTPGQDWAPLQVSPAELLTSVPTSVSGPSDLTYGSYKAVASGTAEITSSRNSCPPPAPGSVACHAIQSFRVTVTVR